MGKRQVQNFKRLLTERILSLQDSIDRSIHGLKKESERYPDPNDMATSEASAVMELAMHERDLHLRVSLQKALERIESGGFGICERCGEAIARKRLLANPTTSVCFDCKVREERHRPKTTGRLTETLHFSDKRTGG